MNSQPPNQKSPESVSSSRSFAAQAHGAASYLGSLSIACILGLGLFFESKVSAQGELATNLPAGFATRSDYLKSLTKEKDIISAYHAGLLTKDEAMLALVRAGNNNSMDIYGKVVDQAGQPVVGAKVKGDLGMNVDFDGDIDEPHYAETDVQGCFHFLGLHGSVLGIWPQKEGYDYDLKLPSKRPDNYLPDPINPVVFTMWKRHGAEPMRHSEFESRVPYDGTSATFNLTTGKKDTNGDFQITLLRSQLKIHRGQDKYDWTVKIKMVNGGLITENDPYPNWASANGDQPSFESGMSSNTIPWSPELIQNFYLTNSQGHFGRLLVDLSTDSTRPDTGITVKTWINPSGSQNLEFDPSKLSKNSDFIVTR